MRLSEVLKNVNTLNKYADADIAAITDDSRKVSKGSVFVCIEGRNFDGHSAASAAARAGAAAVIAQKETGAPGQILVEDTREAYSLMCAAFHGNPADKLKIIGVTGKNGKTTTCFLLKEIFENNGLKTGLLGTVKNMIGDRELPASLTTPDPFQLHALFKEMVDDGCAFCVMEVSSQALDQKRVAGLRFESAVFTNLTRDHLDYHGDFEKYAAAKRILFENTNRAVVNIDDAAAGSMTKGLDCPLTTFSIKIDASDYTAKNINQKSAGVEYELVSKGVIGRVHFRVPGTFSVYNTMGAAACAVEAGVPFKTAIEALGKSKGVPGRMEVLETGTDFTVLIDYAHSPDGLENVLNALKEASAGSIITVFGCGGDRDKTKRPLMGEIASRLSDVTIVTSDNPRSEDPSAIIAEILEGTKKAKKRVVAEPDRTRAIELALKRAKEGDIVLLAGKGHETYQILGTGKIHYDEREVVAEILEKMNRGS